MKRLFNHFKVLCADLAISRYCSIFTCHVISTAVHLFIISWYRSYLVTAYIESPCDSILIKHIFVKLSLYLLLKVERAFDESCVFMKIIFWTNVLIIKFSLDGTLHCTYLQTRFERRLTIELMIISLLVLMEGTHCPYQGRPIQK